MPVCIDKGLLDTGFCRSEVFCEQFPGSVQGLFYLDVDVDGQQSGGVFLCIVKTAQVVVGKVETVLQLGICVLGIGIQTDTCIHHLTVILAGLLALNELLES